MTIWLNDIKINTKPGAPPAYLQLADLLTFLIQSRKIAPDEKLPSVRDVSAKIGVNRGTVLAAYRQLAERGLVEMHVGQGTQVKGASRPGSAKEEPPELPSQAQAYRKKIPSLNWFPRAAEIPFSLAVPEKSLIPQEEITKTMKKLLDQEALELLSYGPAKGDAGFREAYAGYLKSKGMPINDDWILPTSGATQAFDLVAKILNPGDLIFLEEPLYSGTLRSFYLWPFETESLSMEKDGISTEQLQRFLNQGRIPRLVILTPDFQNPTGATLSLKKREEIAWLARKYDFLIFEDAVFSELYYEKPLPSLLSLAPERVIRTDSFSKILAPGLRLGTVVAHPKILEYLIPIKQATDYQTPLLSQATLRELINSGFWPKHLEHIRSRYRTKKDALEESLKPLEGKVFSWKTPVGGFFFWLEILSGVDAQELLLASSSRGVSFVPGALFSTRPEHRHFLRISISSIPLEKFHEGIGILGQLSEEFSLELAPSVPLI
jgi:DNA-binding transcriptional MocR family regulator